MNVLATLSAGKTTAHGGWTKIPRGQEHNKTLSRPGDPGISKMY